MNTATDTALIYVSHLPWDTPKGDKRRFGTLVVLALLVFVLTVIGVELAPEPEKPRPDDNLIPERVATWVVPEVEEEEIIEEEPVEEPEQEVAEAEPVPEAEPKPEPEPTPSREEVAEQRVREETRVLDESLSSLDDLMPAAPAQLRRNSQDANQPRRNDERLQARQQQGSGGVTSGTASAAGRADEQSRELAQTQTRQAESQIAQAQAPKPKPKAQAATGSRSETDIRRVFDRYSGRFNSAYQRALRDNPALQGEVIIALTVAPDGSVSDASIHGSTLDDDTLERRILLIVRAMDFGAANVGSWNGRYPINFFPH